MATITTRAALTELAEDDLLFIEDTSASESKKMEAKNLELWLKREVGQVKINNGNGVKPSYALTADTSQIFSYASPLSFSSFPTTTWPQMVGTSSDNLICDFTNNSFLENAALGQSHVWRFQFTFSGKPNNHTCDIAVRLYNSISGFQRNKTISLLENKNSGFFDAEFITIADSSSLPSPLGTGHGYNLEVTSELGMTVTLEDATRVSLSHNSYAVDI